jgi:hypothetical protein
MVPDNFKLDLQSLLDIPLAAWKNIKKFPQFLSKQPCVRFEDVIAHPELPWDYNGLSKNPNIRLPHVLANSNKPWVWNWLSANKHFTNWEIVKQYPDLPWSYMGLSYNENENITIAFLNNHSNAEDWHYIGIAGSKTLTFEQHISHPILVNYLPAFCHQNPNFSFENVLNHLDLNWNWDIISVNSRVVNDDVVRSNLSLPWSFKGLSRNKNITMALVEELIDKPWDWKYIGCKEGLTWDFIKKHPMEDGWWHYGYLRNPSLTSLDDILNIPEDQTENWTSASANPIITWDVVQEHPTKPWHIESLWTNKSIYKPTNKETSDFYRRVFAVRRIWRAWFRAITHPDHLLCKKRLLQEYQELKSS